MASQIFIIETARGSFYKVWQESGIWFMEYQDERQRVTALMPGPIHPREIKSIQGFKGKVILFCNAKVPPEKETGFIPGHTDKVLKVYAEQ